MGLIQVFVVYLVSGNRPLAEMLAPQFHPLENVFETQFKGMTLQPVGVAELEETRRTLVKRVRLRPFRTNIRCGRPALRSMAFGRRARNLELALSPICENGILQRN